ncbi:hypothetical protein [Flavobacterium sp.]|uniref:hypothetical protein n=1 Tax=Flavobacterium sp. TaxID=239 RepID=UPI002BB9C581|nr:hypothetical protein [Flavobacterium sp.]HSD09307.1 hypothetical protein [Flavobacterium sp.]
MSKTIEIKKTALQNLFLSFLIGFGVLFGVEHLGKFSYIPEVERNINEKPSLVSYVSGDANVASISFESYFGETITTGGNGFKVIDVGYNGGEFYNYKNKLYYITEAFKKDSKYGILFSFIIFGIFTFFSNFNIKFS